MKGALTGIGTDEKNIFSTLESKTADELKVLKANYQDHYGRNLTADLKGELSGKDESKARDQNPNWVAE
jgi:Annexin